MLLKIYQRGIVLMKYNVVAVAQNKCCANRIIEEQRPGPEHRHHLVATLEKTPCS